MLNTLKGKIIYLSIALGMVISLAVISFSYNLLKNYMLKCQEEKLMFSAFLVANNLRHEIEERKGILKIIADSRELDIYYDKRQEPELLQYLSRFGEEFPVLGVVDYDGKEQFWITGEGFSGENGNVSDDVLFQSAISRPGKVIDTVVNDSGAGSIMRFAFAYETYFDEPVGVIMAEVPLSSLTSKVLSIDELNVGKNGFPVVVSQDGEILFHPNGDMNTKNLYYSGNASGKVVASALSLNSGFGRASLLGRDAFVAYTPVEGQGWSLMLVLPYEEFIDMPNRMRNYTLIFSAVLLLVAVVFSARFANNISRSIGRLSDLVWHIAHGDLTKKAEIDSTDEVGDLGMSLNMMSEALRISKEEIESANISLQNLSKHILSLREEERRNISYMLHDELSQAIVVMKLNLAWMKRKLPEDREELSEKANEMSEMLDSMSGITQQIIYSLRPIMLDELGLGVSLKWQAKQFEKHTKVKCEVEMDQEVATLGEPVSEVLFRVCQEALTNVAKHSGATRVDVILNRLNGSVQLVVRDNGRGITEEEMNASTSYGLMGMKERVGALGGNFLVSGKKGMGTKVVANIPMDAATKGEKS